MTVWVWARIARYRLIQRSFVTSTGLSCPLQRICRNRSLKSRVDPAIEDGCCCIGHCAVCLWTAACLLSAAQAQAREKTREDRQAHGASKAEHLGDLRGQNIDNAGNRQGIGRIDPQTFIDSGGKVLSVQRL